MIKIISCQRFISENYFKCDITPKRNVAFYEIELYLNGTGATFINSLKLPHKKNRLIFAKPGNIRFSTGTFECLAIHFTCSDMETRDVFNRLPSYTDPENEIAERIANIIESGIDRKLSILMGCKNIFDILTEVFSDNTDDTVKNSSIPYCKNVMLAKDYIDANFNRQITLIDIAKKTYLSPNFLRDRFTQVIGVSPHKYLNEIRLSKACKLLSTTDKPISDIAEECGFKSQCYMNYVFKKEFHYTPLNYRNVV